VDLRADWAGGCLRGCRGGGGRDAPAPPARRAGVTAEAMHPASSGGFLESAPWSRWRCRSPVQSSLLRKRECPVGARDWLAAEKVTLVVLEATGGAPFTCWRTAETAVQGDSNPGTYRLQGGCAVHGWPSAAGQACPVRWRCCREFRSQSDRLSGQWRMRVRSNSDAVPTRRLPMIIALCRRVRPQASGQSRRGG
jgi:hypothetical protein